MLLTYDQFFGTLKKYILMEVKDITIGKTYKALRNNHPEVTACPVYKKGGKTAVVFYPED